MDLPIRVLSDSSSGTVYVKTVAPGQEIVVKHVYAAHRAEAERAILAKVGQTAAFRHLFVELLPSSDGRFVETTYYPLGRLHTGDVQSYGQRRVIIPQIAEAVAVLHTHFKIVHNDIKPENLFWSGPHSIVLADFGEAYEPPATIGSHLSTVAFRPPESLPGWTGFTPIPAHPFAGDVWALACTVLEIVSYGIPIFTDPDAYGRLHLSTNTGLSEAWQRDPVIYTMFIDALEPDPALRPSALQLLTASLEIC